MHKKFLTIAALLGALSVILGAFTAHALKAILDAGQLTIFETGVRYQFYHAFALLAVGILYKEFPNKYLRWAGNLFCLGILFFSGSLYFLTLFHVEVTSSFKWLFLITPLGGLCFIIGWVLLAAAILKKE
jgi:uncharacterized membrane protein YgdD (TMEM256/DUF423 family)